MVVEQFIIKGGLDETQQLVVALPVVELLEPRLEPSQDLGQEVHHVDGFEGREGLEELASPHVPLACGPWRRRRHDLLQILDSSSLPPSRA